MLYVCVSVGVLQTSKWTRRPNFLLLDDVPSTCWRLSNYYACNGL